ncbi:substrate-binding domain-containing protein [Actinomadura sp. DC4]|uniref:sugar ABC transporter substrate-binding protein n=1 Tax=Actinomadura sp. DC4 TaxID=3055069 RepID=UPI0025AFD8CD|nr:substrate-binding domain-containing protein [Actinomadura sp. DC4]MDN3359081.1 substrate-binding domain-containing protein [Actinomadura sp. DC4]
MSSRSTGPAAAGLLAVTLLAASACGSSSDGTAKAGTGPGTDAHAAQAVATAQAPLTTYPLPKDRLSGVSSLHGKTVYYVPITQQAPQFATTAAGLKKALAAAGLSLQVCNGNSNPSQVSACVDQAAGASAGAIITDSIPYGMAANALDAAQRKKIPVLITDQIPDPAHPASASLAYAEGAGRAQLVTAADWITADSRGSAHVLINQSTDSPSTIAYVAAAQQEFTAHCPDCEITVNKISSANFSLIASSTSSALLRNPKITYVVSEFEQYLQPTLGGVQQSGKAQKIKLVSTAAQLGGLQMLKAKGLLWATVGQASAYQGWADTDAALRLMLKKPVDPIATPLRLFTRDNVGGLTLTNAAQDSGEWFGPAGYASEYKSVWGVG